MPFIGDPNFYKKWNYYRAEERAGRTPSLEFGENSDVAPNQGTFGFDMKYLLPSAEYLGRGLLDRFFTKEGWRQAAIDEKRGSQEKKSKKMQEWMSELPIDLRHRFNVPTNGASVGGTSLARTDEE